MEKNFFIIDKGEHNETYDLEEVLPEAKCYAKFKSKNSHDARFLHDFVVQKHINSDREDQTIEIILLNISLI